LDKEELPSPLSVKIKRFKKFNFIKIMKKKQVGQNLSSGQLLSPKIRYNMKIGSLAITGVLLSVSALAFPQRITLKMKNVPLKHFLQSVQKQTDIALLYPDNLLADKRVNVDLDKEELVPALRQVLRKFNLNISQGVGQITVIPGRGMAAANTLRSTAVQEKVTVKGRIQIQHRRKTDYQPFTIAARRRNWTYGTARFGLARWGRGQHQNSRYIHIE